jgi:hypothetical protein
MVKKLEQDIPLQKHLIENGLKKVSEVTREAQADTISAAMSTIWV